MKTSLLKRSLRTVGLALALGLGLAAVNPSAQAATVQITLGSANGFQYSLNSGNSLSYTQLNVTGDTGINTLDSVYLLQNSFQVALRTSSSPIDTSDIIAMAGPMSEAFSQSPTFTFQDQRINNGALTTGYAQGVGVRDATNNVYTVTLTRVVFDNASTTAPSDFQPSAGAYTEWSPTSTAVPEPGTFIPAAVLVAGALLRRRRSRSHRSGRATA